ncbi:cytochrome P450 monooxygenase [Nemania sp. NC0429]|nr:cytochrome P450 monooxygenase [Nemania sp. NC0429]
MFPCQGDRYQVDFPSKTGSFDSIYHIVTFSCALWNISASMNETALFRFSFPSWEESWSPRTLSSAPYLLGLALIMFTTYIWSTSNPSLKRLPFVNRPGFFSNARAKREYRDAVKPILQNARKQFPNQPYRMTTEFGSVVMLQSEWFDEIRNTPSLSFLGTVSQDRICEIRGFEPASALGENGELVQMIARKQLTKMLNQVTAPLSEEAALAVSVSMGESTEWHEVTLMPAARDIIARMSSRVFLGEELARNEEWLRIMKGYTVDMFRAFDVLTRYPTNLRPYIGWLFPECRRVRDYYGRVKNLVEPVLKKREEMAQAALAAGQPAPEYNDALEWIKQESKANNIKYDTTTFQLIISTVAVNTTTDALHSTLVALLQHPGSLQAVRDEIVQVLKTEGWKKTSLYNMKLMDSALKETQRVRPFFLAMRRSVEADTVLSDGTLLKKGSRLHIDTHRMVDPEVYENPEEWKIDRFLELRSQPGKEHSAQLVTTNVDHFGFGHGEHACPGRFFATNELKVALCHLLIKYDWELAPGTDTSFVHIGFNQRANPATKVLCRKRKTPELDIDFI